MNGKKGVSHIEMIISFAVFMGILAAVFIFIQPVREPKLDSVLLDIVEAGIEKDGVITLAGLPFKISDSIFDSDDTDVNCFKINHPLEVGSGDGKLNPNNIFIKTSAGVLIDFTINSNFIEFDKQGNFYSLSFSFNETFAHTDLNRECPVLIPDDKVTFSAPRAEKLFSINKFILMNDSYYDDYDSLKQKWFIPRGNDFAISIDIGDIVFNMERDIPPRKDVFARSITVAMIHGTDIRQADINIRIW